MFNDGDIGDALLTFSVDPPGQIRLVVTVLFDAATVAISHVSEGSAKLGLLLKSEPSGRLSSEALRIKLISLSEGATYSTETLWPCIIGMAMPKRVELGCVHAQFARIAI